jgi:hypothetical protein
VKRLGGAWKLRLLWHVTKQDREAPADTQDQAHGVLLAHVVTMSASPLEIVDGPVDLNVQEGLHLSLRTPDGKSRTVSDKDQVLFVHGDKGYTRLRFRAVTYKLRNPGEAKDNKAEVRVGPIKECGEVLMAAVREAVGGEEPLLASTNWRLEEGAEPGRTGVCEVECRVVVKYGGEFRSQHDKIWYVDFTLLNFEAD